MVDSSSDVRGQTAVLRDPAPVEPGDPDATVWPLLSAVAGDAAPLVNALSGQEKERVREVLSAFSQNARTALHLDSVFYMSALLYPDDHRKGEPDNLEKLIISLL